MNTVHPVLEVRDIGKAYRNYGGEWRRVLSWFGLPLKPREEHWTLQNISFSIHPGEAIGIIGQNGAGKSTLLKIITGTLKPSTGQITMRGRIAAILELGMGFHPDLSGRQNAYHTAGLMGYSKEQIDSVIGDIEAFAEISEYFDQPVRTYSSGMQMRVAFAAATAWRPEILIVDEALSVGDAYFQHKSFDRIRQFQQQGTTLLLVSHDRAAIQAICQRAILLEKGLMVLDGEPEEAFDTYNARLADHQNQEMRQITMDGKQRTDSGTFEAEIIRVEVLNAHGEIARVVEVGSMMTVQIDVIIHSDVTDLVLGCGIKDRLGLMVFGTNTHNTAQMIASANKGETIRFDVSFQANLGVGHFSVTCALHKNTSHIERNYHWINQALTFEVINTKHDPFVGCAWSAMKFNIHTQNILEPMEHKI